MRTVLTGTRPTVSTLGLAVNGDRSPVGAGDQLVPLELDGPDAERVQLVGEPSDRLAAPVDPLRVLVREDHPVDEPGRIVPVAERLVPLGPLLRPHVLDERPDRGEGPAGVLGWDAEPGRPEDLRAALSGHAIGPASVSSVCTHGSGPGSPPRATSARRGRKCFHPSSCAASAPSGNPAWVKRTMVSSPSGISSIVTVDDPGGSCASPSQPHVNTTRRGGSTSTYSPTATLRPVTLIR